MHICTFITSYFKSIYIDISEYIDLSIYKKSNLFRLPNQRNQEKTRYHEIINGKITDFAINRIPYSSIEYIDSKLYNYNKNKIP